MTRNPFLTFLLLFALSCPGFAQDSILARVQQLPEKYLSQVAQKSRQFEKHLDKRTSKALDRMIKQEKKLQRKLSKVDSLAAKNIFTRSIDSLGNLKAKLKSRTGKLTFSLPG